MSDPSLATPPQGAPVASAPGAPLSANTGLAVGLTLLAMLLFSANDALGKWLVETYSAAQILLIRSLAILAILLPLIARDGLMTAIRVERLGLQVLRVVLSTAEITCFYVALRYIPLADAMAYYLAAPIFVAAMSPFLLGERVGWRRWAAICVGFAGVLVILAPTQATLAFPALLALFGSMAFAVMVVITRKLGGTSDKVLVLWHTMGTILLGIVVAPFAWTPLSAADFGLLGLLGVVAMTAHLCVNRSLKLAPAALVAPYQYTLLVWAILLGYAVFGDVPTRQMLVGAAIIVAAGLFIFAREQIVKREGRGTTRPNGG